MLSKNKRLRETHQANPPKNATMFDSPEKKHSTKLSLFVGLSESFSSDPLLKSPTSKSPRNFDDGVVGLGIVAAMSDSGDTQIGKTAKSAVPTRSEPIPIISAKPKPKIKWREPSWKEEEMELSESYTCVTSHVGGKTVRKRVYFGDGSDGSGGNYYSGNSGVFFESPPTAKRAFPMGDFLSCCYLCRKKLHGLDIFMYRGDKAFCSAECRCQQILSDEHMEKCGFEALKPLDSSVSPCSAPLHFAVGVAAA